MRLKFSDITRLEWLVIAIILFLLSLIYFYHCWERRQAERLLAWRRPRAETQRRMELWWDYVSRFYQEKHQEPSNTDELLEWIHQVTLSDKGVREKLLFDGFGTKFRVNITKLDGSDVLEIYSAGADKSFDTVGQKIRYEMEDLRAVKSDGK